MADANTLGERILAEARARGLSLRQFARLAKLDQSTLSKIVSGGQRPSAATARKLAPLLGLADDEALRLIGREETSPGQATAPATRRRAARDLLAQLERALPYEIRVIDTPRNLEAREDEGRESQVLYWSPDDPSAAYLIAIEVRDACLAPLIDRGDVVIVDRRPERQQPVEDAVVAIIAGDMFLVRRLTRNGSDWELFSPHCPALPLDHRVTLVGTVVQSIRGSFPA